MTNLNLLAYLNYIKSSVKLIEVALTNFNFLNPRFLDMLKTFLSFSLSQSLSYL